MQRTPPLSLLLAALVLAASACDTTSFTAGSAVTVFHRAAPGVEEHWDYDFAGKALPPAIMQYEGLLRIRPDDETLLLDAARAYASYSFGWIEDRAEVLAASGDAEGAAAMRERAIGFYEHARDLAFRHMNERFDGFDAARDGDLAGFRAWLREQADDPEDAASLWWTGYAWGLHVNTVHPAEQARDRAYAIAMVARSVELDSTYYGSSGLALAAYVATQRPNANLDEAREAWDRALAASERTNLLVLVTMARTYARKRRDRELYVSLLREVIHAGDVRPEMRLSNKVARHRAQRYLREVDQLFGTAAPAE